VRRVAELALLFSLFLLFFNFYVGLLPGRPLPRSTGYILSFELRLSALVLALVSGFARALSLAGYRTARRLELACWALYFAGLAALGLSPERADPWNWLWAALGGLLLYLLLNVLSARSPKSRARR
jgi:hypothetical protein